MYGEEIEIIIIGLITGYESALNFGIVDVGKSSNP